MCSLVLWRSCSEAAIVMRGNERLLEVREKMTGSKRDGSYISKVQKNSLGS